MNVGWWRWVVVAPGLLVGMYGCGGKDGGVCGRDASEDFKCGEFADTPAFHVCEDDSQSPPSESCVSLGDSGDYCCPYGSGGGSGVVPAVPAFDSEVDPEGSADYAPDPTTTWQWQLTGTLNTSYPVDIYDVDLFETEPSTIAALEADDKRVVCYFSAGSGENWRPDYDDYAPTALGNDLEGWAGERWLDVTDPTVLAVAVARLDLAVDKGCDGVEPDNMDGFQNDSGFELTYDHQLGFNRRIANEAHQRGLAVLLKNDLDQIGELIDYYDGALNEECFAYEECDAYAPFVDVGKPVFQVEYADNESGAENLGARVCDAARAAGFHTLILPWDLDDSFRVSCDD